MTVRLHFPCEVYAIQDSFLTMGLLGEIVRVKNIECLPLVPRPGTVYVVTHEMYQKVKNFRTTGDLALRLVELTGNTGTIYYKLVLHDDPNTYVFPPSPTYLF